MDRHLREEAVCTVVASGLQAVNGADLEADSGDGAPSMHLRRVLCTCIQDGLYMGTIVSIVNMWRPLQASAAHAVLSERH